MTPPRIHVDFNEMLEPDLVLLSQQDDVLDSSGTKIRLHHGLRVDIYDDDVDDDGRPDPLIAAGTVVPHPGVGFGQIAKWCCRIDSQGIRHQSDPVAVDRE